MVLEKNAMKALVLVGIITALPLWAQPTPAPTTGDAPCADEPAGVSADTVVSLPDAEGYFSLFDGTMKGWFQSCQTGHSAGSTEGAIFRIGAADGKPAIYSTQRGTVGGLLMTKKKFTNYELVFELWPDFGNDGGIFNRTPVGGRCFQTVLDYIGGASIGGSWGEGGFVGRDYRPFSFGGDENTISIPGNGAGELSNWTSITSKLKPTTFGCPAAGCGQPEWRALWDANNWNDFKIQFYGGNGGTSGNIRMKTWFKKTTSTEWVPMIQDTTYDKAIVPGYIGLQVHGGGRFGGAKGTWYRHLRWKPLDDKGIPIAQTTGRAAPAEKLQYDLKVTSNVLVGALDVDHEIVVQDLQGRTLESFSGHAGKINYALKSDVYGWLSIQIKSSRGIESMRVLRAAK